MRVSRRYCALSTSVLQTSMCSHGQLYSWYFVTLNQIFYKHRSWSFKIVYFQIQSRNNEVIRSGSDITTISLADVIQHTCCVCTYMHAIPYVWKSDINFRQIKIHLSHHQPCQQIAKFEIYSDFAVFTSCSKYLGGVEVGPTYTGCNQTMYNSDGCMLCYLCYCWDNLFILFTHEDEHDNYQSWIKSQRSLVMPRYGLSVKVCTESYRVSQKKVSKTERHSITMVRGPHMWLMVRVWISRPAFINWMFPFTLFLLRMW